MAWLFWVGVAAACILILVPLVFVARLVTGVVCAWREQRSAERQRVSVDVAGLGTFSTTDGSLWEGEVSGIYVRVRGGASNPAAAEIARVRKILAEMPVFLEFARDYLASRDESHGLQGGTRLFEAAGVSITSRDSFDLELWHPGDPDGAVTVRHRKNRIVGHEYDH
jgi:hypothetical protein